MITTSSLFTNTPESTKNRLINGTTLRTPSTAASRSWSASQTKSNQREYENFVFSQNSKKANQYFAKNQGTGEGLSFASTPFFQENVPKISDIQMPRLRINQQNPIQSLKHFDSDIRNNQRSQIYQPQLDLNTNINGNSFRQSDIQPQKHFSFNPLTVNLQHQTPHFGDQRSTAHFLNGSNNIFKREPQSNAFINGALQRKSELEKIEYQQKGLENIKEQGFLEKVKDDQIIRDGLAFIKSRKLLFDLFICLIVFAVGYVFYRFNCLILRSRISFLPEIKCLLSLVISIGAKVMSFANKVELSFSFYIWILFGFLIDCLSTQIFLQEISNSFITNVIYLNPNQGIVHYLLPFLSIGCSLLFFANNQFVENNLIQNINSTFLSIIRSSFQQQITHFSRNLKATILILLSTALGMIFAGQKASFGVLLKCTDQSIHCTLTRNLLLLSLLIFVKISLFSLCTSLIINFKSDLIWNIFSETHDIHKVPHFYFILADSTKSSPFLEMKTLKFWSANYTNFKRINIRRIIQSNGRYIKIWELLMNHGNDIKEKLFQFVNDERQVFFMGKKVMDAFPDSIFGKCKYLISNIRVIIRSLTAKNECIYLLERVIYALSNLVGTYHSFKQSKDYKELFEESYSSTSLEEMLNTVFLIMLELKPIFATNSQFQIIFKELMSKMIILSEIEDDRKLFNDQIRQILYKPESFYSS